jgi:small subunit ribosomal protein S1
MTNTNTAPKNEEYVSGESFADLFEQSIKEEKIEGSVVKGRVVAIENDIAIVDVGLKTEGRVSLKEFAALDGSIDLQVGDDVDVYLERIESSQTGGATVSREKAIRQKAWETLETSCKDGDIVQGTIFGRVKGGFTVDINGVIAFLPGSQVDIRPIKDISPLMNILQPFQILKMDTKQGNVVVSRRAILEESREGERSEMLSKIKEGMEMDGLVKNITDYGAFVDLGSVDGLLHVTDISWSRISHPSEVLSLGQKIRVKVIKFNEETKRISLGMKQLDGNPWAGVAARFPKGKQFKGAVTNLTDYGAFVEIEEGIEGLVHVSEISWTKNNAHPSKRLNIGQEVEVMILDIDEDKHRISLGMKQCEDNPWKAFGDKFPVGTILEGDVKNAVDFGLFIGLDGGVDGLIHVSDLSWAETPESELKSYAVGQKVRVKVLGIEPEKERISLGVKQLSDDPRGAAIESLKKGDSVTCIVSKVEEDGIEVTVNDSFKSFIKKPDLARDRVDQRASRFAVGDKVDAKIMNVDKVSHALTLSIKALEVEEQKDAIATYGSTDSGASLGDILGAALNSSNAAKEKKKKGE